jgi:hypothetical protein
VLLVPSDAVVASEVEDAVVVGIDLETVTAEAGDLR